MEGLRERVRQYFSGGSSSGSSSSYSHRSGDAASNRHASSSGGQWQRQRGPSPSQARSRSSSRQPQNDDRPTSFSEGSGDLPTMPFGREVGDSGGGSPTDRHLILLADGGVDSIPVHDVASRPEDEVADPALCDPGFRFPSNETIRIRLLPYNPYFPVIEKDMTNKMHIPIGRYQRHQSADDPYQEGIYFRSTVVSRHHAILSFVDGEFFVQDTKSLGGTFVNSTRLALAGKESNKVKVSHGDVLQFGVDYRPDARTGQVRNKDRCVEVRVEFPKFVKKKKLPKPPRWKPAQHKHTECCICLSALYTKQALFIAPCSHSFHYRCIAPLLRGKGFSCPMCRQNSDLHASLFSLDSDGEEEPVGDESERPENVVTPPGVNIPTLPSFSIRQDSDQDVPVSRDRRQSAPDHLIAGRSVSFVSSPDEPSIRQSRSLSANVENADELFSGDDQRIRNLQLAQAEALRRPNFTDSPGRRLSETMEEDQDLAHTMGPNMIQELKLSDSQLKKSSLQNLASVLPRISTRLTTNQAIHIGDSCDGQEAGQGTGSTFSGGVHTAFSADSPNIQSPYTAVTSPICVAVRYGGDIGTDAFDRIGVRGHLYSSKSSLDPSEDSSDKVLHHSRSALSYRSMTTTESSNPELGGRSSQSSASKPLQSSEESILNQYSVLSPDHVSPTTHTKGQPHPLTRSVVPRQSDPVVDLDSVTNQVLLQEAYNSTDASMDAND